MNKINVCIACDDNYAPYAGVLIASILKNANNYDNLCLYILDGGISETHKEEINSLKSIKDCEINFISVDESLYEEYKKVKTSEHISFATYYRLKLPSMLPNVNRIIYLDCDMVVMSSLAELFNTDIGECYIAGCEDIGAKKMFTKYKGYVNAGMLIFDLDKMREENVEKVFLEYTKANINKLRHSDQDIINYSCQGHIYILDERWNVQSSNFTNRSTYTNEPKIIHFIAKRKPWKWASFSYHRDWYFKYLQLTPWKLSEEEYKHWTKDNQLASLIEYVKYRPLFLIRPRFYKAIFYTYIASFLKELYASLRTLVFFSLNSLVKLFLEIFIFDRQIRAILKGKVARLYLNKYVKKAYKINSDYSLTAQESRKILWQFWEQGIEKAPDIVKSCINSVEQNKGDYEHIILDMNNLDKYVKIPSLFYKLKNKGIIKSAHFSDIVRTYLLLQNGGVWLDATLLLLKPIPTYILNADLFLFQNDTKFDIDGLGIASYFIASKPNNIILRQLSKVLELYWSENRFLINYFAYLHAFTMLTKMNKELWDKIPYLNYLPIQQMQYELLKPFNEDRFEQFRDMSFIHKLSYKSKVMGSKNLKNITGTLYANIIKRGVSHE